MNTETSSPLRDALVELSRLYPEMRFGQLIEMGVRKGRDSRKAKHGQHLKVGICGEHGGDPDSVHFCHTVGMDYVSCSPFRVPIARLAAAQAALGQKAEGQK